MGRQARTQSASGTYHIIQRGIDKNRIFLNDTDFRRYLQILEKQIAESSCLLYAYCLMDNHVHLLIYFSDNTPGHFMQKLAISYSQYFNKKYERTGHLFQNRFKSEPVEDDGYFLTVIRYIHNNPEKAGICKASDYKWSSFHSYLGNAGIVHSQLLLDLIGGKENYPEFMNGQSLSVCMEDVPKRITDADAIKIIRDLTGHTELYYLRLLTKSERESFIVRIKEFGVTSRQIARITGISKSAVHRIK